MSPSLPCPLSDLRQLTEPVIRLCEHPVPLAVGTFASPGEYVCTACGTCWVQVPGMRTTPRPGFLFYLPAPPTA